MPAILSSSQTMIPEPASFGVASRIAFIDFVITHAMASPSTPVFSKSALATTIVLKSKFGPICFAVAFKPTNGPTKSTAPVALVVLNKTVSMHLPIATGIIFLIMSSTRLFVCNNDSRDAS